MQQQQGDLSLAEYIDKATILCNQCEYPPEACDRLLGDVIVIGLHSKEAYDKCIEKGSALTLEEVIEIAQNQGRALCTFTMVTRCSEMFRQQRSYDLRQEASVSHGIRQFP